MPDNIASRKAVLKSKFRKNSNPTSVIIPNKAMTVPIQKLVAGLFFKNKKEPTPTQTGDKLVSKVACVALDSCMEMFQTATSEANKRPQSIAKIKILVFGNLNFLVTIT